MTRFFCISVIAALLVGAGCTRSESISLSRGDYSAFSSSTNLAHQKNTSSQASSEPCSTRTVLPLTLVGSTYHGLYPINVVCTTGMVADLARAVGGSQVSVTQLMGAGVDPHLYKASPGDVGALSGADMVLYSGLHLEAKMSAMLDGFAAQKPTYAVTQYISGQFLLPAGTENIDPHVWLDVSLWRKALDLVRDALAMYDPLHANEYQQRAAEYGAKLDELQEHIKSQLAEVPPEHRVLVTAHDAFRYFGRAYGFEVHGIQGINTENEAGMRQIDQAVDFVVQRQITTVFPEGSVADRNVQAIVEGCRAQGHLVAIGPELFSDSPGSRTGSEEITDGYIEIIRHNADAIVAALK